MGLYGGALENEWVERAYALRDPVGISAFVEELIRIPGLDAVAVYLRVETHYDMANGHDGVRATALYEILRVLGRKPSVTKGQTVLQAKEQRQSVVKAALKGVGF